jgi:large subunit ribosomal protein L24
MKVKVGDRVKILTGKDKGKEGIVIKTLKKKDRVVVEGINIVKKHMKPSRMNETGQILEVENPIHVSNVKVIDNLNKDKKKDAAKNKTKKSTKKEVGDDNE